ncbi:MAG: acyl-CoA thioesterase [Xanthomonadales bacterium]|nr:acyl-CoA thioesterase [Xanthomonadales bacterium]
MARTALTFRFLAEPQHVNFGGKVHGGSVMKWMDEAAYACAAGFSGRYCVTVSVSGIRFVAPIHIGEMVEIHARVLLTGKTSITIGLAVRATEVRTERRRLATRCLMTFVAVDDAGNPVSAPDYQPQTDSDKRWAEYAVAVRQANAEMEALLPDGE